MTAILLVEDDAPLRTEVASELRARGYEVVEADCVPDALQRLRAQSFDVLLTDLRMDGGDGIDLLAAMQQRSTETRAVLMSGFATAKDYQTATELGAVRVLTKPFTPDALNEAIQHAVDSGKGFHGSVHGLSLVDMLQMFHFGRRDIVVRVGGHHPGSIHVEGGEIIHARVDDRQGVDALREILQEQSGALQTSTLGSDTPRTIEQPFQSLLMDTLREIDESAHGRAPSPRRDAAVVDDPFGSWSSIPPMAAPSIPPAAPPATVSIAPVDHLRGLTNILDKLAPQLGAMVVNSETGAPFSIRHIPALEEWPQDLVSVLLDAGKVCGLHGCSHFEYVTDKVALAILDRRAAGYMVLLDTSLDNSFAVQRFRSQVQQVVTYLP